MRKLYFSLGVLLSFYKVYAQEKYPSGVPTPLYWIKTEKEKGKTQIDLAKKLNLSVQSFNAKLNGRAKFDIDEAKKLIEILEIENVKEIFFS